MMRAGKSSRRCAGIRRGVPGAVCPAECARRNVPVSLPIEQPQEIHLGGCAISHGQHHEVSPGSHKSLFENPMLHLFL